MKGTKMIWVINRRLITIALAAVIGFSFAACDNDGNNNGNVSGGQGVPPTITTPALPNGVVGTAYSQTLAATGGTPITWSLEAGALPIGLNLLGNGAISGMPTTTGESTFFVRATNTAGINIKQFSITILPVGGGNQNVDITALNAVILEAAEARTGVATASGASEVPTRREWVTEEEWDAFDIVYKTAVETKANPLSQTAADTAKTNLQAALVTFNAAKKTGSAAAITLSGTITVKNNGQLVPYVLIQAHNDDWSWEEIKKVHLTGEETQWSIITKPFSSSTDISFEIMGSDDDKYENIIYYFTVEGLKKTVYNADVNNININSDLNFITISGTFNLDYNGQTIPSVAIGINRKDGDKLGGGEFPIAGRNTPWSFMIPSQAVDTDTDFYIVGFNGSAWESDQLFAFWGQDYGVKVGNQNKSGIAINLITLSGTVNATYKGSPPPFVDIHIHKKEAEYDWIDGGVFYGTSANVPWSFIIPAFTSDTEIVFHVGIGDNPENLIWTNYVATRTVKNTSVSGIALNLGNITD